MLGRLPFDNEQGDDFEDAMFASGSYGNALHPQIRTDRFCVRCNQPISTDFHRCSFLASPPIGNHGLLYLNPGLYDDARTHRAQFESVQAHVQLRERMEQLRTVVYRYGFMFRDDPNRRDGHCFFHVLVEQIERHRIECAQQGVLCSLPQRDHFSWRVELVKYMQGNLNLYQDQLVARYQKPVEAHFQEFTSQNHPFFAEDVHIYALSQYLDVSLIIINQRVGNNITIFKARGGNSRPIFYFGHEEGEPAPHYQSLLRGVLNKAQTLQWRKLVTFWQGLEPEQIGSFSSANSSMPPSTRAESSRHGIRFRRKNFRCFGHEFTLDEQGRCRHCGAPQPKGYPVSGIYSKAQWVEAVKGPLLGQGRTVAHRNCKHLLNQLRHCSRKGHGSPPILINLRSDNYLNEFEKLAERHGGWVAGHVELNSYEQGREHVMFFQSLTREVAQQKNMPEAEKFVLIDFQGLAPIVSTEFDPSKFISNPSILIFVHRPVYNDWRRRLLCETKDEGLLPPRQMLRPMPPPIADGHFASSSSSGSSSSSSSNSASKEIKQSKRRIFSDAYQQERSLLDGRQFRVAAERGDVFSQCQLGYCYLRGYEVEKNFREAERWYQKAAQQGGKGSPLIQEMIFLEGLINKKNSNAHADYLEWCYQLGMLYLRFEYPSELRNIHKSSLKDGRAMLEEPAAKGMLKAMYQLALAYSTCSRGTRRGVPADHERARSLFEKIRQTKDKQARYYENLCYYNGVGVTENSGQAADQERLNHPELSLELLDVDRGASSSSSSASKKIEQPNRRPFSDAYEQERSMLDGRRFRAAAERGDVLSQCTLGYCHLRGYEVEKDFCAAERWYQKAAQQEREGSPLIQEMIFLEGLIESAGDTHPDYFEWCYQLGMLYLRFEHPSELRSIGKTSLKNGRAMLEKPAAEGMLKAMYQLALVCPKGKAHSLFKKIKQTEGTQARYYEGLCYYNGVGVTESSGEAANLFQQAAAREEKDAVQAILFYQEAAAQGDAFAERALGQTALSLALSQELELRCKALIINREVSAYEKLAEAVEALKIMVERKPPDVQHLYLLGSYYQYGTVVQKNIAQAVSLYQVAASQGQALAKQALAQLSHYNSPSK